MAKKVFALVLMFILVLPILSVSGRNVVVFSIHDTTTSMAAEPTGPITALGQPLPQETGESWLNWFADSFKTILSAKDEPQPALAPALAPGPGPARAPTPALALAPAPKHAA